MNLAHGYLKLGPIDFIAASLSGWEVWEYFRAIALGTGCLQQSLAKLSHASALGDRLITAIPGKACIYLHANLFGSSVSKCLFFSHLIPQPKDHLHCSHKSPTLDTFVTKPCVGRLVLTHLSVGCEAQHSGHLLLFCV